MTEKTNGIAPNDFLAALVDLDECSRVKDRGVAKLRTVRQRMEKMGCDMPALDLALSLRKLGSGEAEMRLRNALRYARWMSMEIGDQGSLFSDDADRPSEKAAEQWTEAQAYNEGYAAGIAGRDRHDHRFTLGTGMAAKHDEGWVDGQRELADRLGKDLPENGGALKPEKRQAKPKAGTASAAGKPRGRGRGRGRASARADI